MASVSPDVILHPLGGEDLTVSQQLKLFHLAAVVLDPYTHESAWLLETGARILRNYAGADCRAALVLTCDEPGARRFLGPLVEQLPVFVDPDRELVKALGVSELPAFVHLALDCSIAGLAEGWDPDTWRPIAENLSEVMSWSRPAIPEAGDPVPYAGTPAVPA